MKIRILGSGCPNCKRLEQNARDAAAEMGIEAEFEKVTDIDAIMDMGVMFTPGLVIDGVVKSSGKVLTKDRIKDLMAGGK